MNQIVHDFFYHSGYTLTKQIKRKSKTVDDEVDKTSRQ